MKEVVEVGSSLGSVTQKIKTSTKKSKDYKGESRRSIEGKETF